MLSFSILADGINKLKWDYSKKLDNYTPNFEKIEFFPKSFDSIVKHNLFEYYSLNLIGKGISIATKSLPKPFRLENEFCEADLIFESEVYVLSGRLHFDFYSSVDLIKARDIIARYSNKYNLGINLCEEKGSFKNKVYIDLSRQILENKEIQEGLKDSSDIVKDSIIGVKSAYSALVCDILK
jgi:hypothetical protein